MSRRYKTKSKKSSSKTTLKPSPKGTITEAMVLESLRNFYHSDLYESQPWAIIDHVRNEAGYKAKRTIDAISVGLWPSKGNHVSAYEIKCARSDWLAELKNLNKSKPFTDYVDYFWIVQGKEGIVREDELPDKWGLLTRTPTGRMYIQRDARKLKPKGPIPRGMWVAIVKRLATTN